MRLWQLDLVSGIHSARGRECQLLMGIDELSPSFWYPPPSQITDTTKIVPESHYYRGSKPWNSSHQHR